MIIHREVVYRVSRFDAVRRLTQLARERNAAELLVEAGELEQAAVDALHPQRDTCSPLVDQLRRIVVEAAAARLAPDAERAARHLERSVATLRAIAGALPPVLHVQPPRGYCYDAVEPLAYAEAGRRYLQDAGPRAAEAVVLGIRSIGTSLSAAVAAACGARSSWTVRLRGTRETRRVQAEPDLGERVRAALRRGADVLVVDQPPGSSVASFATVVAWLVSLGAAERSVVLFPGPPSAWTRTSPPFPRPSWYERARKYLPASEDARPGDIARERGWSEPLDVGGGRWRSLVRRGERLPAWGPWERVKHLARDREGRSWQIRYVGLGAWGRAVLARAEALAAAGLGPVPQPAGGGFIVLPWVRGSPLRRSTRVERELLEDAARYLALRGEILRTGAAVRVEAFARLLADNGREAGAAGAEVSRALRRLKRLPEREAVVPDARLRPWEWLRTPLGHVKTDALDHGDTFRAPGPTDAAWDLAGLAVEFTLNEGDQTEVVRACARRWGEDERQLGLAVAAYRPVYAATCWAEAALAASAGPEADPLLAAETSFYRRALFRELRGGTAASRGTREPLLPPPREPGRGSDAAAHA